MKSVFKIELDRAFINKKFFFVILIEAALIVYDFFSYVLPVCNKTIPFLLSNIESGKVDSIPGVYATWVGLHYGQTRTILFTVLPLLCALVYGASLYLDEKFHYNYQIIVRAGKKSYYTSKLFVLFLVGGVVASFPFMLSLLMNSLVLPYEKVLPCLCYFMGDKYVMSGLFYSYPLLYVFIYILLIFIEFGLLNCICFIISDIFSNSFIIVSAPFCIYFCSFVISNLVTGFNSPWLYFRISDVRESDIKQILCQVIIYLIILVIALWNKIRKDKDV